MSTFIRQPLAGQDAGAYVIEADATQDVVVRFGGLSAVNVIIGRGTTDTDITFIALRAANGTLYYVYGDANGLTTSATRP